MYNIIILTHIVRFLGGYHMITAKEARERINALETERGKQERKTAEEKINKAVEKGESYCWLGVWISDATEGWLTSLGYQVKRVDSQKDGSDVKVEW